MENLLAISKWQQTSGYKKIPYPLVHFLQNLKTGRGSTHSFKNWSHSPYPPIHHLALSSFTSFLSTLPIRQPHGKSLLFVPLPPTPSLIVSSSLIPSTRTREQFRHYLYYPPLSTPCSILPIPITPILHVELITLEVLKLVKKKIINK